MGETIRVLEQSVSVRAYPRRHGGNEGNVTPAAAVMGLSPQARGKLKLDIVRDFNNGPIPAGTGETISDFHIDSS